MSRGPPFRRPRHFLSNTGIIGGSDELRLDARRKMNLHLQIDLAANLDPILVEEDQMRWRQKLLQRPASREPSTSLNTDQGH